MDSDWIGTWHGAAGPTANVGNGKDSGDLEHTRQNDACNGPSVFFLYRRTALAILAGLAINWLPSLHESRTKILPAGMTGETVLV